MNEAIITLHFEKKNKNIFLFAYEPIKTFNLLQEPHN